MAKTNYSKVEVALEEGLRKMSVSKLCDLADIAAGIGHSSSEELGITHEQQALVRKIKLDLMRLHKKDRKIYSKLELKKSVITNQLENPNDLQDEDWENLKALRDRTETLIKVAYPEVSDDEIIERQQTRHITKRFNVNETWLPMK